MQVQSGRVIAQKNAKTPCDPASLTKMMTILLAVEALPDLDEPVTMREDIFAPLYAENASMAGFCPGETVTVRDLLYGGRCCHRAQNVAWNWRFVFAAAKKNLW